MLKKKQGILLDVMESVVVERGKTADTPQWIAGGHQTYLRFQRFGKHPRDHSLCPYVVEREKKQRKQLFNPVRVSVYLAAVLHHRIESGSLSASLKKELIRGHLFWDNLKWRRGPPQAEISILDDENEASVFEDKSCTTIACVFPFELGNTQRRASLQKAYRKKEGREAGDSQRRKKKVNVFSTWLIKTHAIVSAFWYSIQIKRHGETLKLRIERKRIVLVLLCLADGCERRSFSMRTVASWSTLDRRSFMRCFHGLIKTWTIHENLVLRTWMWVTMTSATLLWWSGKDI